MATVSERHPGGSPRSLKRCPLGERIEHFAQRNGMHLDQVAEAAGISFPTLNRICTGRIKSPKWDTMQAIATALGVKLESLKK